MSEDYGYGGAAAALVRSEVETPDTMAALVQAETDVQVSTAKMYPRSIESAIKRALSLATLDEETAASCMYALPRGGKTIEGPSIRLAEIVASCWGNMRIATQIIQQTDSVVVSRGFCWDLETNLAVASEARRRITDKSGGKFNEDMINVTCNAANAIARRNAVFAVVPRAYIDKIYRECRNVAVGNASTLTSKREKLMQSFMKIGVLPDQIYTKLGVGGEQDINLQHLAILIGVAEAIKSGEITPEDAFAVDDMPESQPAKNGKTTAERVKDKIGKPPADQDAKDAVEQESLV